MSLTEPPRPEVPPAVRLQILATEHWSLLATRSTMWAEVMSRITIHLTVSSATLVVLALVGQASEFGVPFRMLAMGLASVTLLLGTLTGVRVMNASQDDAGLILAMNRLRGAYVEIDPTAGAHFRTSTLDDDAGLIRTYTLGTPRSTVSHVLGSTAFFMNVVNAVVAGTLGALVADAVGGSVTLVTVAGVLAGLFYLTLMLEVGRRMFSRTPFDVDNPR